MKISKSKQELARIISENGGWRDGVEFFASTCNGIVIGSKSKPKYTSKYGWVAAGGFIDDRIELHSYLKNWHQTILSRAEYFHLYPAPDTKPEFCESVMRSIPEPTAKPTIEQLASDYQAKLDIATRAQEEADAHRCGAEVALSKLEIAVKELGFRIELVTAKQEPELVITDWRDLRVGDEVECVVSNIQREKYNGMVGRLHIIDESDTSTPYLVGFGVEAKIWCNVVKFIRRP